MPRARLGVALLVPEPVAAEIDGMRRGLGDGALGRIPAHLTLVPPVNVALERLDEAGDVLRAAAAGAAGGLDLTLGPVTTFWPVTPVVYLAVGGDLAGLLTLRQRVFRAPLSRPLTHDFVPHVTLADEVPSAERIGAAVTALADYHRSVRFERLQLLREGPGRIWEPIAETTLGPARLVGRGGLPVELVVSSLPDATVTARLGSPAAVVVTARREGEAVGVAHALLSAPEPDAAWLARLDVVGHARGTGIGSHLLAALCSELADRGSQVLLTPVLVGEGAGFLEHMGFRRRSAEILERRL